MTLDINQIAQEAVKAGGNVYVLTIQSGSSPTIVFGNHWGGATSGVKKVGKKEDKPAPAPPPSNPPPPVAPPAPVAPSASPAPTPSTGGSAGGAPPAPTPSALVPPSTGAPPPPPASPPVGRTRR